MSFILNALRKSEQDRLTSHTQTLEDKIIFKQVTEQKHRPGWLLSLLLVIIMVLLLFLWHFTRQEEQGIDATRFVVADQADVSKRPIVTKQTNVTEQAVAAKPVIDSDQAQVPDQIKQEKTILDPNSSIDTTSQLTIAEQVKKQQEIKKPSSKQAAPLNSDPVNQAVKEGQPIPIEAKENTTEQEEISQKPQTGSSNITNEPPYLSEMPLEFRLSVPKININVFVYTELPKDRFIMIKMRKYQVGQKIFKKIELLEIRPDSIVVKFHDKVFQIRR